MLTERTQQFLLEDVPADMADANPFVTERGCTYLRYDAIEIANAGDSFGGVKVGFKWRGTVMLWMRVEGVALPDEQILTLTGIEGRQRVSLTGC